jgi:transposase InsO family protein
VRHRQRRHTFDRGSQYLSAKQREQYDRLDVRQSAGRAFDNGAAEWFRSSLKRELVHRYRFATRADALAAITAGINRYNNVRHSTLGYVPPIGWELHCRLSVLR